MSIHRGRALFAVAVGVAGAALINVPIMALFVPVVFGIVALRREVTK